MFSCTGKNYSAYYISGFSFSITRNGVLLHSRSYDIFFYHTVSALVQSGGGQSIFAFTVLRQSYIWFLLKDIIFELYSAIFHYID